MFNNPGIAAQTQTLLINSTSSITHTEAQFGEQMEKEKATQ